LDGSIDSVPEESEHKDSDHLAPSGDVGMPNSFPICGGHSILTLAPQI
jgi:hypothetical protein